MMEREQKVNAEMVAPGLVDYPELFSKQV